MELLFLLGLPILILNIALFFKIWRMTNDIGYMRDVTQNYIEHLNKN